MTDRPHWSEGLNEAQLRAASYDSGPLAVLAGPGTGKTRVITHRIARMIHDSGASPGSIYAMTFTVKAAREMQSRLGEIVGAAHAQRVSAGTFHSLGRRILTRFGDMIGLSATHDIMDSVQQMRLLTHAVGDASSAGVIASAHLAAGGREGVAQRALAWIEHLRTLAIFPEEAHELGDRWQALIERAGPDTQGENWEEDHLHAQRLELDQFRAACAVYERFTKLALERSLLTFDDFILLPIRILREVPMARALVRDEVRHLVVDEFQDVNGAQLAFLKELAPPERSPDLCVVGDDDQAIYGFRGSDDRAFQHFTEIWTDAETITLTKNYRSSEAILATAHKVISESNDRFEPDKVVDASRDFGEANVPDRVEAVHVEKDRDHGVTIASMILADRAKHPDRALSSYAVIASSHKTASEIGRALELEGIAVDDSAIREDNVHPAVRDVISWIEAIVGGGGSALTRVLVRPPVSMPALDAIELQQQYDAHVRRMAGEDETALDAASWMIEHAEGRPFVAPIAEIFRTLRELSASLNATQMITEIIQRVGIAQRELPSEPAEPLTIAALIRFMRFAQDLQARLDPPGDLGAFWRYFNALTPEEQTRGVSQLADLERSEDESDETEGVKLLTAHASKGLEFDTVFIPKIGAKSGHFGSVRLREGPVIPDELSSYEADARDPREREQDEVRRLLYVACTRAERRLVLTSEKAKSRSASMHLFQELAWRGKVPMGADDSDGPVSLHEGADVVRQSAELGASIMGSDALVAEGESREARSRVLSNARTNARRNAARALDLAEFESLSESEFDSIVDRMTESARELAIIGYLDQGSTKDTPSWLLGNGVFAEQFTERLASAREDRKMASDVRPLKAPLELSFSTIDAYQRCPACFYLRQVLGLREESSAPQIVGIVAHKALERFFVLWREADASGVARPTREDLVSIARDTFVAENRRVGGVDPASFDQIRAQLESGFDALHDERAEIMMLEERIRFAYERASGDEPAHRFEATLDRVDRTPAGGFRIIDYKTGYASKKLSQPKPDDLQLGIYALALARQLEIEPENLEGSAEYWLFSTGEKGVLPLSELRLDKVQKVIDTAIAGMLAGEFSPKKGCSGPCSTFLSDDSSHPG